MPSSPNWEELKVFQHAHPDPVAGDPGEHHSYDASPRLQGQAIQLPGTAELEAGNMEAIISPC